MKKFFSVILIISIVLTGLVGCSKDTDLAYSKENPKFVNKKVKAFMDMCDDKNGVYFYTASKDVRYLFLNGATVKYGDKAPYFSDIKIEVKENTLVINFNENYTDDYENKKIDYSVLYKIKVPKGIEFITIYKNGQQTHIDNSVV